MSFTTVTTFTPQEESVLEKGLKHTIAATEPSKTTAEVVADLTIRIGIRDTLTNECANFIGRVSRGPSTLNVPKLRKGTSLSQKISCRQSEVFS